MNGSSSESRAEGRRSSSTFFFGIKRRYASRFILPRISAESKFPSIGIDRRKGILLTLQMDGQIATSVSITNARLRYASIRERIRKERWASGYHFRVYISLHSARERRKTSELQQGMQRLLANATSSNYDSLDPPLR